MRILVVTNLYPPHVLGGYELACRHVALGLRNRGHHVEVLAGHAPFATTDDPPWVHRQMTLSAYNPVLAHAPDWRKVESYQAGCSTYANSTALLRHIRRTKPDVVYVWHVWGVGGLALLDLLEQLDIPWIMHLMDAVPMYLLHDVGAVPVSLFARAELTLLSKASVIAMSEQVLEEIAKTTGVRFETPPIVIPGWVDTRGLGRRSRYRVGGRLRLVAAGSLGGEKGTDLILYACAQLLSEGYSNFIVDIFGLGHSEPWTALADQLNVSGHVRFHGARTQADLLAVLPQYDVFLFPVRDREPFGLAPIEAAACGVVPIVTRNAGVAERLVDGVHAVKIDRTAASLAGAVRSMLDENIDVAAIGSRAARLVRRDLNFEHCLQAIERALESQVRPWDTGVLDDPRLVTVLYAKHELGRYFTFWP